LTIGMEPYPGMLDHFGEGLFIFMHLPHPLSRLITPSIHFKSCSWYPYHLPCHCCKLSSHRCLSLPSLA
jgi:hypothetical protein